VGHLSDGFAIGWETHPWQGEPDRAASRRQRLTARGPYQAAVPVEIAQRSVEIIAALQAEAEDAVREIARFDDEVTAAADRRAQVEGVETITELAPLASVLLRTESASSSEIEGVTAGARALALAAVEAKTGPNAQLVTANVVAMQRAIELADDISVDAILAAHEALLTGHAYAAPGRLRTAQVWIGSNALSPHTASFVPPHHTRVEAAMADLMAFVQRVDLPVLVECAIAHAQFETIHPFNDGNGRVGRALVHAMLRHADVTRRITVPVSAGLLTDTSA
jgi:Fic family protein